MLLVLLLAACSPSAPAAPTSAPTTAPSPAATLAPTRSATAAATATTRAQSVSTPSAALTRVGTPVALDACALITRAEYEALMGPLVKDPNRTVFGVTRSCTFLTGPENARQNVTLMTVVRESREAAEELYTHNLNERTKTGRPVQPLSDLCCKAVWVVTSDDPKDFQAMLYLVKNNVYMDFNLWHVDPATALTKAKALAEKVTSRVP